MTVVEQAREAAGRGDHERAYSLLMDADASEPLGSEGLALLAVAISDEVDPLSVGLVYCELVCAWQGLAQHDRAEELTEAMQRWRQRHPALGSGRAWSCSRTCGGSSAGR